MRRAGLGGTAAIVAAAALLAIGLAGDPLYVSSSGSEALQVSLRATCATDAGLALPVPTGGDVSPVILRFLDDQAKDAPHSGAPIVTSSAPATFTLQGGTGARVPVVLLNRTGQLDQLGIAAPTLATGEALAPAQGEHQEHVVAGSTLLVTAPVQPSASIDNPVRSSKATDDGGFDVVYEDGSKVHIPPSPPIPLAVTAVFPDIPIQPEPSYWCGQREVLRPSAQGDPPPLVMLVDTSVLAPFRDTNHETVGWELRPAGNDLTTHEADQLEAAYGRIETAYRAELADEKQDGFINPRVRQAEPRLGTLIAQARQVADVVARTMAPIRLAGVGAGVLLLAGAAVLLARERRRELRLRLLRGEAPWLVAMRVAGRQAVPVVLGTALGAGLALVAVITLGPTPELEPGPVRRAAIAAALGGLASIVLVGAVTALAASRTVDRPARRRVRWIPWELAIVALAVLSSRRLDEVGGVRLVGDQAAGGDLLAQAFPLLAIAAPLAVLARPLALLARRSRRWGGRLPVPILSGLRRVGAEAGTSVMIAAATGLAVGAFVVSSAMTDSSRQLLTDKAAVYIGGDEAINVTEYLDLPPGLHGTVVGRVEARGAGNLDVTVIGVDPATFAAGVHWRADAADRSLASLLATIADPAPGPDLPAIVIGRLDSGDLQLFNRTKLSVHQVATARWFPGQHNGSGYVVVNRAALIATGLPAAEQVWLRRPPADASNLLRDAGFTVGASQQVGEVFDVVSFLAVKWSYASLTAFGIVIGLVVVMAQLLVLDARRRVRQANGVLSRPMGQRTGGLVAAIFTELAIPFGVGAGLGIAIAMGVLQVAVTRLDTLRQLPPPARVVVDLGALGAAFGVVLVALVGLTLVGVVGVRRADRMEVMRSAA